MATVSERYVRVPPRKRVFKLQPAPVISIVDDDGSIRSATQNLVRSLGFRAYIFASAEELLNSEHLDETSCVITDLQMPGMSGADLQNVLIARGRHLPVIFITAFPNEKIRQQALRSGAIAFLTKPFDGEAIIKHIEVALDRNTPSGPRL